jgi:hypothetical protein
VTSFTPTYDPLRVMTGMAAIYLAPFSEASPAALPAESVALGGAWPSSPQPWTAVGASEQGASVIFRRSTQNLMIEEQLTPILVETTEVEFRVEITLAEDTLETMRTAMGGGTVTTTAAASGQIGKKTLVLANDLTHFALGLESKNSHGFFRRMLVPNIVSIADVETSYRRAANLRLYKISLWCLSPIQNVTIVDKTANALP